MGTKILKKKKISLHDKLLVHKMKLFAIPFKKYMSKKMQLKSVRSSIFLDLENFIHLLMHLLNNPRHKKENETYIELVVRHHGRGVVI